MIYPGDGALGFGAPQSVDLSVFGAPEAGDVNLDGHPDLVVGETSFAANPKIVEVAIADGTGGFSGFSTFTIPTPAHELVVGRIDTDPFPDVLVATFYANGTSDLNIAFGDGTGAFTLSPNILNVPASEGGIHLANLDGDGLADLVIVDGHDVEVHALVGDGAGGFTVVQSTPLLGFGWNVSVVGEIDGDGLDDLIVIEEYDRSIFHADGTGGLVLQSTAPVDCRFQRPSLTDIDGDGDEDLITSASVTCASFAWFERISQTQFADVPSYFAVDDLEVMADESARRVFALDMDGDDDLELVTHTYHTGFYVMPLDCRGGASRFGHGCAGSGGVVPRLGVVGCAELGNAITLEVDQGLGGAVAILLFGTGEGSTSVAPGCSLLPNPLLPLQLALPLGGSGPGQGSIAVPALLPPSAGDITLTTQAFLLDGGAPFGFAATAGLALTISS